MTSTRPRSYRYSVRIVICHRPCRVLLAGCGSGVVERGRICHTAVRRPVGRRAAVDALECEGKTPYRRGQGVYDDGLASVQESAEAALDDYMSESGLSFSDAV